MYEPVFVAKELIAPSIPAISCAFEYVLNVNTLSNLLIKSKSSSSKFQSCLS